MTRSFRRAFLVFACLSALFSSLTLCGQIALRITLPQQNYLLYEPIYIRIDMRNVSGHPIVFGEKPELAGRLDFEILSKETGNIVSMSTGKSPSTKGIVLQPGTIKSFHCNLTQFYRLFRKGQYKVRAIISHPRMARAYRSNDLRFTVTEGKKIWEAAVGIPLVPDAQGQHNSSGMVHIRKYSVLSYFTGTRAMYMLMIEDPSKVYCLRHLGYNLGNMLLPQCAVDNYSRLHVVIAGSPKVFSCCVFDVNGRLVSSEVRLKTETAPTLAINRELGTVVLTGGRKAVKDKDYETIKDIPFLKGVFESEKALQSGGGTLFDGLEEAPPAGNPKNAKKNETKK